ncbi:ABC transporter permease [Eisenbergiella sp.]
MWKDYSSGFIKNNKASSLSIMAAALIVTLFLSFLCTLFYNFWMDETARIILEDGDWDGRITGEISELQLSTIKSFANVEKAVINNALSGAKGTVVDIYFYNRKVVYQDMPLIAERLGLEENEVSYNTLLLSQYLIHDPNAKQPPMLLSLYLVVLVLVSFSLILIICNSFAVSMNARIHQFGIFSSIGATPGQIRFCLMQEAAVLSLVPILAGWLLGIALSFGVIKATNLLASQLPQRDNMLLQFYYHPAIFAVTILASLFTVLFSAWLPAIKLSRMTPLEAIRNGGRLQLKKKKKSRLLALLFGMEGELAGNALKAQKKALRTSTLSLTLSFFGFSIMMSFFSLSTLSTQYTYFEKYQNVWDIMVTLKDTKIEDFRLTEKLREIRGIQDCVVYQKAMAKVRIPDSWQSDELAALGGPAALDGPAAMDGPAAPDGPAASGAPDSDAAKEDGGWLAEAPIVILDDDSFTAYCEEIGITPRLDGTIILNQIWDSLHSNFRHRIYVPYVKEEQAAVALLNAQPVGGQTEGGQAEIPVLAYTQTVPVLKEEYDDYALVQFMPLSLWEKTAGQLGGAEEDSYVRILSENRTDPAGMTALEQEVSRLISPDYDIVSENRIQDKITNDLMIQGYQLILGGLCVMLALIGIANIFSYTLGFLHQRKREFAQYMSIGLTPGGIRKMFCIEAMVIALRPLLITLPLTAAFIIFAVRASYLNLSEFLPVAPVAPIAVFSLAILVFVALAYYIGGKKILRCTMAEALRDDTLA